MERRPTSDYVWLGTSLRYLHDARAGYPIHGIGNVVDNIGWLHRLLPRLGFPVSARAIAWSELALIEQELATLEQDALLDDSHEERLGTAMGHMWATVLAEASGVYAFVVSEKRLPVDKLLEDPGCLLAPGIFRALSDAARLDLEQAARCIAYEVPTAAAFHLMRGTEAVLRDYYCAIVKHKRLRNPMWGQMVAQLRTRKTRPSPPALLDHLDSIRVNFRNPTQHPDAIYDIHEVQTLWSLCIDVIERMVRDRLREEAS